MTESLRKKVKIVLMGFDKPPRNPICEEDCPLWRKCANHGSAGDYREESGFTPALVQEDDASWTCDQTDHETSWGMLFWDKKLKHYRNYTGYDYDE